MSTKEIIAWQNPLGFNLRISEELFSEFLTYGDHSFFITFPFNDKHQIIEVHLVKRKGLLYSDSSVQKCDHECKCSKLRKAPRTKGKK